MPFQEEYPLFVREMDEWTGVSIEPVLIATHLIPMPRHSGLLELNGRFYLNIRLPNDLRAPTRDACSAPRAAL